MPEYRLAYRVKTPLTSAKDVCLDSSSGKVKLLFSQKIGVSLLAQVDVEAAHYSEAQATAAGPVIPPILDALSFTTGTTSLLGECEITLKKETGMRKRRGIYVGQRAVPRSMALSDEALQQAERVLSNHDGPTLPLCWFRYSHQRDLTLEKFVFAWLGFEELAGDTDISSQCPRCKEPLTHRGANKEHAWEVFHDANPTVERRHFDREIWGRARNSLFHGGRYPSPEFLSFLAGTTPQIQKAVERELRKAFAIEPAWTTQKGPEELFRVFLFFEWETTDPDTDFATDWPEKELRAIVGDADLDQRIRLNTFPLTLRTSDAFADW